MATKKQTPGPSTKSNGKLNEEEHSLNALSPLDGRYKSSTKKLGQYFSEFALQKYRLRLEVLYLKDFCRETGNYLSSRQDDILDKIESGFSQTDAKRIKEIEKGKKNRKGIIIVPGINHDLKSVEVFLREKLTALKFGKKILGAIHFGLTSGDIDNIARTWMLADASNIVLSDINRLIDRLKSESEDYAALPMLARTHGQPALPTTYGKEVNVFKRRLVHQLGVLTEFSFCVKFGGAVGNFNALQVAYPDINWETFADNFVKKISSQMTLYSMWRERVTTQIDAYDSQAEFLPPVHGSIQY
jgi:adenylosuccinate lyase